MTRKRILPLFLLLVLSIPLVPQILPNVHASNIIFDSKASQAGGSTNTNFQATVNGVKTADALLVDVFGMGAFNGFTVTDSQANTYTQKINSISGSGSGASTYIYTTTAGSSGSVTVTVATGGATRIFGFTVLDYSNVASFGITPNTQIDGITASTGTGTVTFTGTQGSASVVVENIAFTGSGTQPTITNDNGQTTRDNINTGACNTQICRQVDLTAPATSFSLSFDWSATACATCSFSQSAIELVGSASGTITQITQCFGNCGNPAITLVNTNSTHSINFNQSLTVFYEFQSTLSGILLNVTTNIARNYLNNQQVNLGVYTASCNLGVTPFSASCPGQLRASQTGNLNPVKGRLSFAPSSLNILSGQFVAISLSGVFSGLDINDTNTNVALFQQNGQTPPILAQAVSNTCACKMGLWTFITGNTVTGIPPPATPISCGTDFICQLTQACIGLTPTNIVIGCFFLGIVWSIITIAALMYVGYKFGGIVLPGGVFILIFWAWTTFFLSLAGGAGIAFIILEAIIVMIIFSGAFGSLFSGGLRVGSGRETA